uniref:SOWAHA-C winged helix-turn-helix domain-containing protein n=1 Tax=Nothobranchius furzeri TaxID=105023 RepID=A0A8C6K6K2_NOTFU
MATDFTQDSVLLFLRSSGGSVRNADLLLHFRPFLQDPANRDRNRELFKKFVNALAIVKQVDGVSHVFLRKKFRGPGAGPDPPEPSVVNPALPSETGRETVLPAAGLKVTTTNPTETTQKLVNTSLEPGIRPVPVRTRSRATSAPQCPHQGATKPTQQPTSPQLCKPTTASRNLSDDEDRMMNESQVPLDAREHAWMVKAAAGAWTDIYSLFREDKDLLNKPDFISGFTVLHWIAKHGDHRVGMNFNINAKSRAGQTPLHVAAIHGHKNVIRLLVSSFKANVTLRDTAGKKPWQYLSNSSPDMLELLKAPRRYGGTTEDSSWSAPPPPPPQQRRRLQHHFSSASSGLKQSTKVKRSTSIAAFLKNKALTHF